jgi:hypothetical protein
LIAGTTGAPAADAAYPGENGRIFFQACGEGCGRYDVYSVNPDGSGLENVTDELTAPEGLPDDAFEPSVSGDGTRVAFSVDTQANSEIWAIDSDGGNPQQLTDDNLLDQQPAISPDRTRVAWNQWSPFPTYGDRDIWVMGSDGSSQELLFNGGQEDYFPQFTPDGQTIVMASETGDQDIRKIPSTPAEPPLTVATGVAENDELLESEPTVSPDGTRVAFSQRPTSSPLDPFDIYAVGIDGGPTTPLFDDETASEASPAFSPDGTKIAFVVAGQLMIGNADGSGTPTTLELDVYPGTVGSPDWAPKVEVSPPAGGAQTAADVDPPETRIEKGPRGKSKSRVARFRFTADETGGSFRCRLDGRKYSRCSSPKTYRHLRTGKHVFRVFAVDPAGNADPTPARRRFKVCPSGTCPSPHQSAPPRSRR